jgi:hypothetical protein
MSTDYIMFRETTDKSLLLMCDIINVPIVHIGLRDSFTMRLRYGWYIVNTDDETQLNDRIGSLTGGGTHWTCFQVVNDHVLYFDPFGLPPPPEIKRFCMSKKIYVFPHQIQSIKSEACGYYCIDFIRYFSQLVPSATNTSQKVSMHMSRFGVPYDYNIRDHNETLLKARIHDILNA